MSEVAAASPPEKPSVWEDLVDVFVAPAQVFRRRVDGKFGPALLVLVVLTAGLFFATRGVMQPIYDAELTRSMAANPAAAANPEALETARKFGTTLAPVFVIVGVPIGVLIAGIFVWGLGRIVGARIGYLQGVTIYTFAAFPRLIASVAGAVQAFLMDEAKLTSAMAVSLGLGRFLDPTQTTPTLLAVLGRVEVFTLWSTVLVGIGLSQMGRTPAGRAAIGAAILWVLGAIPMLLQGLRAG